MDNLNLLSYSIYLPVTMYITVWVGWLCYRNGEVYLEEIFEHDRETTRAVNKILLTGYYLLNLGYATVIIRFWQPITSIVQMIEIVCSRIGAIVIFLGLMHYFNIWVTARFRKKIIHQSTKSVTN